MKFQDFQKAIENYPYFSTKELRLILGKKFNKTLLSQLKKWEDLEYLIKLKKSIYLLNRKDVLENLDASYLAAKIYKPSYVSLEFALSYYGIIPEAVNIITSITTRKTATFKNKLGAYSYQHIKPSAYLGFKTKKNNSITYQFADKEKALADYLYFNKDKFILNNKYWDSLRLNLDKNFSIKKLKYYTKFFTNKKLDKIILNFTKYARSKFY